MALAGTIGHLSTLSLSLFIDIAIYDINQSILEIYLWSIAFASYIKLHFTF